MQKSPVPAYPALLNIFAVSLLILGCGSEEVNSPMPPLVETPGAEPIVTPYYFPLTPGSTWTYRDVSTGDEWTRELTERVQDGPLLYAYFRELLLPPGKRPNVWDLDLLKTSVLVTTPASLRVLVSEGIFAEMIQQIIRENHASTDDRVHFGANADGENNGVDVAVKKFDPKALALIEDYDTLLTRHGKFVPIRLPFLANETYTTLNMRFHGYRNNEFLFFLGLSHGFEAEAEILAKTSYGGTVETPAGTFADSLKIQYEPSVPLPKTEEYKWGNLPEGFPEILTNIQKENIRMALEKLFQDEIMMLLELLMSKIHLETVWFAPGVGPVKFEGANGTIELIDYEIKAVDLYRTR